MSAIGEQVAGFARGTDILTTLPPDVQIAVARSKSARGALLSALLLLLLGANFGWLAWENAAAPDLVTTSVVSLNNAGPAQLAVEWNPAIVTSVALVNATWPSEAASGQASTWQQPSGTCLTAAFGMLAAMSSLRMLQGAATTLDGGIVASSTFPLCPAVAQTASLSAVPLNAVGLAVTLARAVPGSVGRGDSSGVAGVPQRIISFQGRMYLGGEFTYMLPQPPTAAAGTSPQAVNNVISWGVDEDIDGCGGGVITSSNSALLSPFVEALAVFQGLLWVGGYFDAAGGAAANNLATWNGSAWTAAPNGGMDYSVFALATDAAGTVLYAGGAFDMTADGTVNCSAVAMYDGHTWRGLLPWDWSTSGITFPRISALLVWNGALIVGGSFAYLDPAVPTSALAAWDGTAWSPIGGGVDDGPVNALAVFHSSLVVGGAFNTVGDGVTVRYQTFLNVALWTGSTWMSGGGGVNNAVTSLLTDPVRSVVYFAGIFSGSPSVAVPMPRIAQFDGAVLTPLGAGLTGGGTYYGVTLAAALPSSGALLYAAGTFTSAGGSPVRCLAKWDGASWQQVGLAFDSWNPQPSPSMASQWAIRLHVQRAGVAAAAGAQPLVLTLADILPLSSADLSAALVTVAASQTQSYRTSGGPFGTLLTLEVDQLSLHMAGPGGAASAFQGCNSTQRGFTGYGASCCLPLYASAGIDAYTVALNECLQQGGVGPGAVLLPDVEGPAFLSGAGGAAVLAPDAAHLGLVYISAAKLFPNATVVSTARPTVALLGAALGIAGILTTVLWYVKVYVCSAACFGRGRCCAAHVAALPLCCQRAAAAAAVADIFPVLPPEVTEKVRATKSVSGGALTLLLPLAVAAYYAYLYTANNARPDSVTSSVAVMDLVGPTQVIVELNPSLFGPPGMAGRTITLVNASASALVSRGGMWSASGNAWTADGACASPTAVELAGSPSGVPRLAFSLCPDGVSGDATRILNDFGIVIGLPEQAPPISVLSASGGTGVGVGGTVYGLTWWRDVMWMFGNFVRAGPYSVSHVAAWGNGTWLPPVLVADLKINTGVVWRGQLCFCGHFTAINNISAAQMACWDGSTVHGIATGLGAGEYLEYIIVHNDQLCAGGSTSTPGVVCFDGTVVTTLSVAMSGEIDGGLAIWSGMLCAAGSMQVTSPDGMVSNVGCWNVTAAAWQPIASSAALNGAVEAIVSWQGLLVIGGTFLLSTAPGVAPAPVPCLAVLNTTTDLWQALPSSSTSAGTATYSAIISLVTNGSTLLIGGNLGVIAVPIRNGIGVYSLEQGWGDIDGQGGATAPVPGASMYSFVKALALDGTGNLWIGGDFDALDDGTLANNIAYHSPAGGWTTLGARYDSVSLTPAAPFATDMWAMRVFAVRDNVPSAASAEPLVLNVSDVLPVSGQGLAVQAFTAAVAYEESYAVAGGAFGRLGLVRRDAVQLHVIGTGGVTGAFVDCPADASGFLGYGARCCVDAPPGGNASSLEAWNVCAAALPPGALLLPSSSSALYIANATGPNSSTLLIVAPSIDRVAAVFLMADSLLSRTKTVSTRASPFSLIGVATGIMGMVVSILLVVKQWGPMVASAAARRCGCDASCQRGRATVPADAQLPAGCRITRLLREIDVLTYNPPDLTAAIAATRTPMGGLLTALIPVVVLGYAAFLVLSNELMPDAVATQIGLLDGQPPLPLRVVWNPAVINVSAVQPIRTATQLVTQGGAFALDATLVSSLSPSALASPCLAAAAAATVSTGNDGVTNLPLCPSIIGEGDVDASAERGVFAAGLAAPLLLPVSAFLHKRASLLGTSAADISVVTEFQGALYVGTLGSVFAASPGIAVLVTDANGARWAGVGQGVTYDSSPMLARVQGLAEIGSVLHVVGAFTAAISGDGTSLATFNHAMWDGTSWSTWGGGVLDDSCNLFAVTEFNGTVYVGGSTFGTNSPVLLAWSGTAWYDPTGGGSFWGADDVAVYCLVVWADTLVIAGDLADEAFMLQYDGTSFWYMEGGIRPDGLEATVQSLVAHGDTLFVGGEFAGGVLAWTDAGGWSMPAGGLNSGTAALVLFHGQICAGGDFWTSFDATVPTAPLRGVACLDSASGRWTALGAGLPDASLVEGAAVQGLTPFNGTLVAVGSFAGQSAASSDAIAGVAAWDGDDWRPLCAVYDTVAYGSQLNAEPSLQTWAAKVYLLREDAGTPLVLNVSDIVAVAGRGLALPLFTLDITLQSSYAVPGGTYGSLALANRDVVTLHAVGDGQAAGPFLGCTTSQRGFLGYGLGCCWSNPLAGTNSTVWSDLQIPADMVACARRLPPSSVFLPEIGGPLFLVTAGGGLIQLSTTVAGTGLFFLNAQSLYTVAKTSSTKQAVLALIGSATGIISVVITVFGLIKAYGPSAWLLICSHCNYDRGARAADVSLSTTRVLNPLAAAAVATAASAPTAIPVGVELAPLHVPPPSTHRAVAPVMPPSAEVRVPEWR